MQNQQQDQIPLVPPPLVDMQKQPKLDLQTIQPQFQAPTSPTTTQSNVDASGEQDQTNFVSKHSFKYLRLDSLYFLTSDNCQYFIVYNLLANFTVASIALSIAKCSTNWNSVTITSCVNNHQSTRK